MINNYETEEVLSSLVYAVLLIEQFKFVEKQTAAAME
jgi:hypothetical protein